MFHAVYFYIDLIIIDLFIGFSRFVRRLSRNGFSLENLLQHCLQLINVCIHIITVLAVIFGSARHQSTGGNNILFGRCCRLSAFASTIHRIIIGICIKNHEYRIIHQIHIRKFHRIPVVFIGLGIVKIRNDLIAIEKLQTSIGRRKRSFSHLHIHGLHSFLGHSIYLQVSHISPLFRQYINRQHRRGNFHMRHGCDFFHQCIINPEFFRI